jgi:hypothetical protein
MSHFVYLLGRVPEREASSAPDKSGRQSASFSALGSETATLRGGESVADIRIDRQYGVASMVKLLTPTNGAESVLAGSLARSVRNIKLSPPFIDDST